MYVQSYVDFNNVLKTLAQKHLNIVQGTFFLKHQSLKFDKFF